MKRNEICLFATRKFGWSNIWYTITQETEKHELGQRARIKSIA